MKDNFFVSSIQLVDPHGLSDHSIIRIKSIRSQNCPRRRQAKSEEAGYGSYESAFRGLTECTAKINAQSDVCGLKNIQG